MGTGGELRGLQMEVEGKIQRGYSEGAGVYSDRQFMVRHA